MKSTQILLTLLPLLARATSLTPRQAPSVEITSVSVAGVGCEPDTFNTSISEDGSAATFSFSTYESAIGASVAAEDREKHCQLFVKARFPVGCTSASISTTYHGSATLDSEAAGVLAPDYVISSGELTDKTPQASFLSGSKFKSGDGFERVDETEAKVTVDKEENQEVEFVVRSRTFIETTASGQEATVTADDVTVKITDLKAC
ncbi:uncharacterized protein DNG_09235 [Cephalotrichum gorgonifer]|uniref:Uncharacterized protein n=1 Tax=Cephalotrichum gorgonifer TaxID=2041049 RepID=A0AAE8N5A5_9PEZI|nr:uncharacterized protein DNG_09235 [Cephalotrichum gorgonifer]